MQLLLKQKGKSVLSRCFLRWSYFLFWQMLPQHKIYPQTPWGHRATAIIFVVITPISQIRCKNIPSAQSNGLSCEVKEEPRGFSSRPQNSLAAGGDVPAASENKQCTHTEESLTQTFGSHLSWSSYPEKPSWLPASGHMRKTPGTWTVLCLSPFFLSLSLSLWLPSIYNWRVFYFSSLLPERVEEK